MPIKINLMPEKTGEYLKHHGRVSLLYFISAVLLTAALMVFFAIFVWRAYFLEKDFAENKSKNVALKAEISDLVKSPSVAANMKAKSTEKIIANHLYPSKFYALLESMTLKAISYDEFSMNIADDKSWETGVKLSGEADSLKTLAKQLIVFRESADISDVFFRGAQMNKNGKVEFDVELIFKGDALKFSNKLSNL